MEKQLENKLSLNPLKLIAKTAIGIAFGTFFLGNVIGYTFIKDSLNQEKAEKIINNYEKQTIFIKIPMFGAYSVSKDYLKNKSSN